ncbi:MAG TPA: hypothetical protein VFC44_18790 [Candidatus Saccharimonadales bacterium]|nr:hypothetical protein [Candidatus Saccharimonadales bacterium]
MQGVRIETEKAAQVVSMLFEGIGIKIGNRIFLPPCFCLSVPRKKVRTVRVSSRQHPRKSVKIVRTVSGKVSQRCDRIEIVNWNVMKESAAYRISETHRQLWSSTPIFPKPGPYEVAVWRAKRPLSQTNPPDFHRNFLPDCCLSSGWTLLFNAVESRGA